MGRILQVLLCAGRAGDIPAGSAVQKERALHEKAMKGMKNSSPAITLPPYRYLFLSALPLKKISHWLPAFSENQSALGCPLPQ